MSVCTHIQLLQNTQAEPPAIGRVMNFKLACELLQKNKKVKNKQNTVF